MSPTPEVLQVYEDGGPCRVPLVLEVAGPQTTATAESLSWHWETWPCSDEQCDDLAEYALTFRDQYGHVHHCSAHMAESREWYDVATVTPLPCPHDHGTGQTWVDYPQPLEG